jgi:hypothetical protein
MVPCDHIAVMGIFAFKCGKHAAVAKSIDKNNGKQWMEFRAAVGCIRNGAESNNEWGLTSRPWPGLSRPSTSFVLEESKTWMPGTRPGMTGR